MMATTVPPSSFSFLPLLECLEDSTAGQSEQTDAYLTIANRFSGEEGRQFIPAVEKHFSRLGNAILAHITSPNAELSQAALQALGFCVYHSHIVSGVSETFAAEILSALCSLVVKSPEKNTCTRALWVMSKQSFPPGFVAKKVSTILSTLESVWSKDDIQSVVMEHEALNVIIRMLEQVPAQMGDEAVRLAKLVVPLVVHSAPKVRLRAAAAMEMGMPLLLKKQMDVAAVIEPMMSSKLIPELQKLFMSKNETNVLKLWPLFVKLLGKLLHRGGPFINSLLHLEELGFRSSSPTIKKIAFIAWKSLIDNFALNPDILCSAKRMKLLMQPLSSINVRTEALLLTKVEVWWYLVVQLGPNLSSNFDQVAGPLLQCTIGSDSSSVPGTPARVVNQNGAALPVTPKSGNTSFNNSANTPRISMNSSVQAPSTFPSIQLLGLEMLLHYLVGPEVVATAAKSKIILTLEPLNYQLISAASSFSKHAAVLISNITEGFISIGKEAPDPLLSLLWSHLVHFVNLTIESGGSKKDRQGCEALTLTLQALQSIVASEALPADRVLVLFETTVKGLPHRVLGSASYQVGKMDVLNGTPALFLILLLYNSSMLSAFMEDVRFYQCLQMLVGFGLSGPTSPLAFGEAVLGAISRSADSVQNKEQLLRMWSVMVNPLTDTITQSNEVNQGDALEHNFSAMHSALLFPVTHLLSGTPLQQVSQKSMLSSWSKLYKVFARCSSLVVTAEENICCEELCAKMAVTMDRDATKVPSTLTAVASIIQVMVECVDFSPFTPQFQQKLKSPHTPVNWTRKRNKALGNLSSFHSLLVLCLDVYLESEEASEATGMALLSCLSALFTNLVLANTVKEVLTSVIQPLTVFYKQAAVEPPKFSEQIVAKLENLLVELLGCLQSCSTLAYDDDLLALLSPLLCVLFPHKNKQLRTSVSHFWNSTFANFHSLTYPEELRPVLSQVKQKTPIILPGFEVVSVPDELSGEYSSESSQLGTKLSGMPVLSLGKRDSLLTKATEVKDRNSTRTSKVVSTKLDFGSPKPPRREVLEEEASIDFVFIPPETKERVLTEHQKEVKRTKRVDIPAMYNNLDASLDTTVFSQFTQSQEDSMGKLPNEQNAQVATESPGKVADKAEAQVPEVQPRESQDNASPKAMENKMDNQEIRESADIPMEEDVKSDDARDMDTQVQESQNISRSSDSVSGTPQKSSSSRRQAFITLEKYTEGKPASPSTASTFSGPLIKTFNSQEHSNDARTTSSQASQKASGDIFQTGETHTTIIAPESPRTPKVDGGKKSEPVRLTERMENDTTEDEDVIPDTQTQVEEKNNTGTTAALEEIQPSGQEYESQLMDSQCSLTQSSPAEPRRSGRYRVRPLLPGDDPEELDAKYTLKKRRSGEENKSESPGLSTLQSRPNTRSKQTAEEEGRLRTRAQREKGESSQSTPQSRAHKKIKLYSNSEELLPKPEYKRRSTRVLESSQSEQPSDSQSDHESQSHARRGRRRKSSLEPEQGSMKSEVFSDKESSQIATQELVEHSQRVETEPVVDSQVVSAAPLTGGQSQEFDLVKETRNEKSDSQTITTSPTEADPPSMTNQSLNEADKKKDETIKRADSSSQEDSQKVTPSLNSQSLRRPRRSKAVEGKTENADSSRRKSRSNSQEVSADSQSEVVHEGRTRRSKAHEEQSSPSLAPESSQSLDVAESSQGGRYPRRRSSQALVANMESSESESSEARENSQLLKKRGRKPRVQSQSPLTIVSKDRLDSKIPENVSDMSQRTDSQSTEASTVEEDSAKSQDLEGSESIQVTGNIEEQSNERQMEVIVSEPVIQEPTEPDNMKNKSPKVSPRKKARRRRRSKTKPGYTSSQESDTGELESSEMLESVDTEQVQGVLPSEPSAVNIQTPSSETTEKLQVSESSKDSVAEVVPVDEKDSHSDLQELTPGEVEEPRSTTSSEQNQGDCPNVVDEPKQEECTSPPLDAGKDDEKDQTSILENDLVLHVGDARSEALDTSVTLESMSKDIFQDSPAKQKDMETAVMSDIVQSPSSGRTRGTWSPSASPSTSILKKGQKRPLEEETPSPLVKSRRVSFANPIQQQETADDIDRRSPAIRTSSPRRSKTSSIPQPKYVTTPTKGLLIFSPRNLHSPGYKSSKKCLISEMSQEPRAVSKDCIYPALVGCSAPVEAVLPQISSNMWSRGFGQLVRARNIKTVGDLSALTASEIKALPIRSPKVSNVKKALKSYELQRKGRGVDELKSFDEMEMMTSELEETSAPRHQDEEEKNSGETLATKLVDEPIPVRSKLEQDRSVQEALDSLVGEQPSEGLPDPEGLLAQFDALNGSMTPLELSRCSPQQLVHIHDQLGGLLRRVVVELQTRLSPMDD
ncbi:telomere-associated protein RIF1 [Aulostomus maculatus]